MNDGTMIMPWGKHKGRAIEELPSGYLKWLADNCEDDEICEAAQTEYDFRSTWRTHF